VNHQSPNHALQRRRVRVTRLLPITFARAKMIAASIFFGFPFFVRGVLQCE